MPPKTNTAENKNEKIDAGISSEEIAARRELLQKEEELEAIREENKKLSARLAEKTKETIAENSPDSQTIEQLSAQVELLTRQVITGATGSKLRFREPIAADLVKKGEEVTFIARNVLYLVASYRDSNGIERMPPHKLIAFQYAASDVRRDGREETVKNFCQYTTNLKTEIDFLRKHPYYGITFSENTNEILDEDVLDTQYKIRAANQLAHMPPEQIFARAEEYNIPNFRGKTAEALRILVVHEMAKAYKAEKKAMDNELIKRQALGAQILNRQD